MHHPITAAALATPAGAPSVTLRAFSGSFDAIPPGVQITIAGSAEVYGIASVTPEGVATLDRPLVQEVPAVSAITFRCAPNAMGDYLVDKLTTQLQGLRDALARGEAHADQTESDRSEAEKAHAGQVADAMVSGKPVPAKPARLSALQAADDSADAALETLRQRIGGAENAVFMAVISEGQRRMRALFTNAGAEARDAIDEVMASMARLSDAVGAAAFPGIVDHIVQTLPQFRLRASRHDQAVTELHDFMSAHRAGARSAGHMIDGTRGDEMVAAGWPTRESIARAAEQAAR